MLKRHLQLEQLLLLQGLLSSSWGSGPFGEGVDAEVLGSLVYPNGCYFVGCYSLAVNGPVFAVDLVKFEAVSLKSCGEDSFKDLEIVCLDLDLLR